MSGPLAFLAAAAPAATAERAAPIKASPGNGDSATGTLDFASLLALSSGSAEQAPDPGALLPALPVVGQQGADAGGADAEQAPAQALSEGVLALLEDLAAETAPPVAPTPVNVPVERLLDGSVTSQRRLSTQMMTDAGAAEGESTVSEGDRKPGQTVSSSLLPDLVPSHKPGSPGTPAPGPGSPEFMRNLMQAQGGNASASESGGSGTLTAVLQQGAGGERLADPAMRMLQSAMPQVPREASAALSQTLEQVAWMSREGVHQARLQLEPAHLGRVDIRLDIEGGEARLHLASQQPLVREALEAVLPRLREALAEQGMNLTDASVSHSGGEAASGGGDREATDDLNAFAGDESARTPEDDPATRRDTPLGLLDLYA